MTMPWYLVDAHSADVYCDGAVKPKVKAPKKHKSGKNIFHHSKRKHLNQDEYNPYSTLSRKEIKKASELAIAEARKGQVFADGILMGEYIC